MQCIVLFGIQGSGKGTQAKRLSEALGYSHINMGDLLRDHVARNTKLGSKVEDIISVGALVDDLVDGVNRSLCDARKASQLGQKVGVGEIVE